MATLLSSAERFLFSYFTDNGEDGLHLATSSDGLSWKALNGGQSLLASSVGEGIMRDPCLIQGSDRTFHLVWSAGWWERGIGYAHSTDLEQWTAPRYLPIMAATPEALNAWAPEVCFDVASGSYVIFWASTVPGRFMETEENGDVVPSKGKLNHRMYYTQTRDFKTFTETALLYDPGFNVIDASLFRRKDDYVFFVKDETFRPVPKKNIRFAKSSTPTGPFEKLSEPFSPDWVEGPSALEVDGWVYVYFDAYCRERYEGVKTQDFVRWESITDVLSFPKGARHGSALRLNR